jgi:hypothetical protein
MAIGAIGQFPKFFEMSRRLGCKFLRILSGGWNGLDHLATVFFGVFMVAHRI